MTQRIISSLVLGFGLISGTLSAGPVGNALTPEDIRVPSDSDTIPRPLDGLIDSDHIEMDNNVRPPITTFVPFKQEDPETKKPLNDNDVIFINGKQYKAKDYFRQLNAREKELNALGYTLHDPTPKQVIDKLKLDMDPIIRSARNQGELDFDVDPRIVGTIKDIEDFAANTEAKAEKFEDDILRGFEKLASSDDPNGFKVKLGPLDEGLVKEPTTKPLSGDTHKEWTFGPQSPGQIGISGKAIYHFGIDKDKKKAEAIATARSDGMLLKQPFNLLYGHIYGVGLGSDAGERYSGDLSAEVYLSVLGVERFKWSKKKHVWTKKVDLTDKKKKPADGGVPAVATNDSKTTLDKQGTEEKEANPVTEWIEVNRKALNLEPWSYNVVARWTWHFMVGPVPGRGEVGIDGHAGVDWGSGVNIDGVKAFLNFNAGVSVYGQGSLGIEQVLEGGVRADMVLVDVNFDFDGSARLSINDKDLKDGGDTLTKAYDDKTALEVKVITALTGTRRLTFLKGQLMAYVNYPMPKETPPFYQMKRYENVFYNWNGFEKNGLIFSFQKVNMIGKFEVFGASSSDDNEGAQLDVKLDDHFHGILQDGASHVATLKANDEAIARQDNTREAFDAMIQTAR